MVFVCLALAWLSGFAILRRFFPAPVRWSFETVLLFSLATGLGMAIASSLYFIVLAMAGPRIIVLGAVESVAAIVGMVLGITAKPRTTTLQSAAGPATPFYLKLFLIVALASAATMFVLYSLSKPHGEWDAWAIWNLHARFLSRAGQFWTDAFSRQIDWSHPDYPLLLPGIVALCWTLAHTESVAVPMAVAFLFTFGAAAIVISTVGILRGKTQALIAGVLLVGTATFIEIGATQYADIPLSFFIVATLALLSLEDRHPENLQFSVVAGLSAGFAAWTKNEGLLFVVAVVLARTFALLRLGKQREIGRQLLSFAIGLAPPLVSVAWFKLRYAPPNDLMSRGWTFITRNLTDPARWITTVEGFLKGVLALGGFLVPIALVLALYWYLVRFHVEDINRPALLTAAVSIAIMLAGDFTAYLLLSSDVNWQIGTSIDRLLLQLWPSVLLMFFLAAAPPELVAKPRVAEKEKPAKGTRKARRRVAETH